jgi:predicted nuclease of predicted toxin-antitoxin system
VRFKLDENLPRRAAAVLADAGFDVVTVSEQRLEGAPDRQLIEWCVQEERCLVTLDAEFGNPLRYPPHRFRGIVLLRLPAHVTNEIILETLNTLRDALLTRERPAVCPIPFPARMAISGSSSRDGCGCTRAKNLAPDGVVVRRGGFRQPRTKSGTKRSEV